MKKIITMVLFLVLVVSSGIYMDFVDETYYEKYQNTGNSLYSKINEKSTGNSNVTDGSISAEDGVEELLALETCVDLLQKDGTPDLKQFFDTYAKENAQVIRKDEEKIRMNNGEPLRPKVAVNFAVGQLDAFYDTYSVEALTAYYVSEKKRIQLFK